MICLHFLPDAEVDRVLYAPRSVNLQPKPSPEHLARELAQVKLLEQALSRSAAP